MKAHCSFSKGKEWVSYIALYCRFALLVSFPKDPPSTLDQNCQLRRGYLAICYRALSLFAILFIFLCVQHYLSFYSVPTLEFANDTK